MKISDIYSQKIETFEAAGITWSIPKKLTVKQVSILQPAFAKLDGDNPDLTQLTRVFAVVGDAEGNLFDEAINEEYDKISDIIPLEVMVELVEIATKKLQSIEEESEGN